MDPLRVLEKQSGILRLLVYLSGEGEKSITEVKDHAKIPINQLYSSIDKGKELGLIKTRIDSEKYPPRNLISVTEKGKSVAKKLEEITVIILSKQSGNRTKNV